MKIDNLVRVKDKNIIGIVKFIGADYPKIIKIEDSENGKLLKYFESELEVIDKLIGEYIMTYDIYQLYRALKDYDKIKQGTLLRVERIERTSSIGLKEEGGKYYHWLNARELLNEENFQRVF